MPPDPNVHRCALSGMSAADAVWSKLIKCKEGVYAIKEHEKVLYESEVWNFL